MTGTASTSPDPFAATSTEQQLFRLAVEACPNGMVMTDGAGKIVLVNSETERLFGYQREQLMGQTIELLVPERLRNGHSQYRAGFARDPKVRRLGGGRELFGRHRDGAEFPVEIGLNPIHAHDGLLVLSAIVDISERKRLDRLKDEFVATVSHELRTPLTSIAGSLGLLAGGAGGVLPPQAARLIAVAQNNCRRLVRLINDILDIEKIQSGKMQFHFRRIDLPALVANTVEANRSYAESLGIGVRLASAPTGGEVYADGDRLAQVLTNLLSNAVKFSPPQGEVVVSTEAQGQYWRVAVRDHGPGIPENFRPHVFESFAQADATDARQKGGSGLGLSIVKRIMSRLGGAVGFADADGGGTVFHADLPSWEQVALRAVDGEAGDGAVPILLCEDDPDMALALRDALRADGFATDFAYAAADALTRAATGRYAAIIVDLEMPDGTGRNLVGQLRAQPQSYQTPILLMSADKKNAADAAWSAFGVHECIDKPPDVALLAQILQKIAACGPNGRPRILHVDDDRQVLQLVARALAPTAAVVSVDSIDEARRALAEHQFNLVILDVALGGASGLDLLPHLRNRKGAPIPVIVFSAHAAALAATPQVEANLDKANTSLKTLVDAVHDRLALHGITAATEAS